MPTSKKIRAPESRLEVDLAFIQLVVLYIDRSDTHDSAQVIIVGAGLGGLGAAIAILLAGHNVTVLESTAEIGEVKYSIHLNPTIKY